MPELPEVETIRRHLEGHIIGARIESVTLRRRDILRQGVSADLDRPLRSRPRAGDRSCVDPTAQDRAGCLEGATVRALHRHGKQLAIESCDGRVLRIQLGMSGRLMLVGGPESPSPPSLNPHVHAEWTILTPTTRWRLLFEDPRRFGALTAFASLDALHCAWRRLGPDALSITEEAFHQLLRHRRRTIKSLLLDQSAIAGIGNIYADEILHCARIDPRALADHLRERAAILATCTQTILARAIELGGSTIRDHRSPEGHFGSYQRLHRVYSREGQPCLDCRPPEPALVRRVVLGGRSSYFCPRCQHRQPRPAPRRSTGWVTHR